MYKLLYIPTGEYAYIKIDKMPNNHYLLYFSNEIFQYEAADFKILKGYKKVIKEIIEFNIEEGVVMYLDGTNAGQICFKDHLQSFEIVEV